MRKKPFCTYWDTRREMPLVLACCWICGLLCGVAFFSVSSPETFSVMRRAVLCPVSIVGLINAALIPFLLSAFFALLSMNRMVMGICFVKAFLFAFVSLGMLSGFGSGGWLLRFFLLFGDSTALPLLYWCWMRFVRAAAHSWIMIAVVCCLLLGAIILDYRVIAPFVCMIDSMKG